MAGTKEPGGLATTLVDGRSTGRDGAGRAGLLLRAWRERWAQQECWPPEEVDAFLLRGWGLPDAESVIRRAVAQIEAGKEGPLDVWLSTPAGEERLAGTSQALSDQGDLVEALPRLGLTGLTVAIDDRTHLTIELTAAADRPLWGAGRPSPHGPWFRHLEEGLIALDREGGRVTAGLAPNWPAMAANDQIWAWYRLVRLGLRVRRFRLDGGPLVADPAALGFGVVTPSFLPRSAWEDLFEILDRRPLADWRLEPGLLPGLFRDMQIRRLRLAMAVARHLRGLACRSPSEQEASRRVLRAFLGGEALLESLSHEFQLRHVDLREIESQIRWRAQGLRRLLHAFERPPAYIARAARLAMTPVPA
ncbi:MAG: hypothetical protein OZSIB_3132 [Candidatus Ozemobacter sibiricus]|uniref:Uncharacterized protein n=1 Tax=Candidatus Ozemobacter sibiricus TaxID=2268124 RepID=A0A367ZQR1_9BACT|nr:MAG: hypothetical protein OZSIB_3132 [Candidatus Ozemobacter sibiricus]